MLLGRRPGRGHCTTAVLMGVNGCSLAASRGNKIRLSGAACRRLGERQQGVTWIFLMAHRDEDVRPSCGLGRSSCCYLGIRNQSHGGEVTGRSCRPPCRASAPSVAIQADRAKGLFPLHGRHDGGKGPVDRWPCVKASRRTSFVDIGHDAANARSRIKHKVPSGHALYMVAWSAQPQLPVLGS